MILINREEQKSFLACNLHSKRDECQADVLCPAGKGSGYIAPPLQHRGKAVIDDNNKAV